MHYIFVKLKFQLEKNKYICNMYGKYIIQFTYRVCVNEMI